MKVLVTGAAGLLGTEVWKVFSQDHEMFALGRTHPAHVPQAQWRDCDLRDAAQTYQTVTRINPDFIVHCASYNDVDGAETHPDEAFRANALGPRNLALACQRFDTVLMAVSSDYVFEGTLASEDGYKEIDPAHPISVYGHSKRWGEIIVEQLLHKYFIVRTSWLFGPARPTFVDKVLEWARNGQSVPCVQDMRSTPTFTPDLAKALKQLGESGLYGLYHLTNSGFCTRVELAREILQLHKLSEKLLKPTSQSEFKHAARRPAFSGLKNYAWQLNGFAPLRPWKEAMREHFGAALPSQGHP